MKLQPARITGSSLLFLLAGCVAPGSSFAMVSIEGRVAYESGEPVPNCEVRVVLPAEYALGGLDVALGEAGEFGNQNREIRCTTGPSGEFSIDFGVHLYSAAFWILPPFLFLFAEPPAPFVILDVPRFSDEYYGIETGNGRLTVFNSAGSEISVDQAKLVEAVATSEVRREEDMDRVVGRIDLRFKRE